MFQVLIADDEPSVVKSLKESVDWSGLGLCLTVCASGSREVLEIVERTQVDIAILDIRMPGISGLELCEILRKKNEHIQLIIISGYAEFSYAERAIGYGVLGYCLKPLEYEKIIKLLRKAVRNLEIEKPMAVDGNDLLDMLESGGHEEARELLMRSELSSDRCFVTVTMGDEKLAFPGLKSMCILLGRGQWGYLSEEPPAESEIQKFLSSSSNKGIGFYKEAVKLEEIATAIQECMVRACQFWVAPECKPGDGIEGDKAAELLEQIRENMERGRWEAVCGLLQTIEEKYRMYFTIRSSSRLCNMIHTSSLYREGMDNYIYNLEQLLTEYTSLSDMLSQLRDEIRMIRESADSEEFFTNAAFMKIMLYIRENYRRDISLAKVGTAVHMNPNYVSQLFKKETGVTFIQYITQLRMEDAMQLLAATEMSVVDIAMDVGFHDYFYFLKIFKKYTGKTRGSRYGTCRDTAIVFDTERISTL